MQFNLNYHDGIFEVTTSGDAVAQVFNDFAKALFEHEEWKPGEVILLNHSELNAGTLTNDDIRAIASISGLYCEQFGEAKVACLVGRELEYGMARMWQTFVDIKVVWSASEKLFMDRDEAVTWLKSV